MTAIIPQYQPSFDDQEAQAISDYLLTDPWLTEYKQTAKLEQAICDHTGVGHCIMTPNATLALVAAYHVLGVGPNTEVICPALTQQATANAAKLLGATVRFVDVDPNTLCLDVRAVKDALRDNTRAVALVYFNGRCPNELRLMDLAEISSLRIPIVEDAAQALGSLAPKGSLSPSGARQLGTLFDVGVISFSTPKIISTGQGGCLLTNSPSLADALVSFKDFGRRSSDRGQPGFTSFHTPLDFGINLKFTDLQAVVGLVQMRKLSQRIGRKKYLYQLYRERLQDIPEVSFLPTDLEQTTPWMVDIYVDDREDLVAHLTEVGIGTRPFYPPVPSTGPYHKRPPGWIKDMEWPYKSYPVAETASRKGLWLPCSPGIKDHDVEQVCMAIRKYYGK